MKIWCFRWSRYVIYGFIAIALGFVILPYWKVVPIIPSANSETTPYSMIVIGGASDPLNKKLYHVIRSTLSDHEFAYFQWYHRKEILSYIAMQPPAKKIILLGHSLGGNTATHIFEHKSPRIELLITLDPVGPFKPKRFVRSNWLNVVPKQFSLTWNNFIASLGGRWGVIDQANNLTIQCDHNEVDTMLLARDKHSQKILWDIILSYPK